MKPNKTGLLLLLAAMLSVLPLTAQEPFNPAGLLQGSSPSVLVSPVNGSLGEDLSVLVRGGGGIRGITQPLWVVDGIEINPSLAYLNIYDIENIWLETDLSSTSRFGNRGANGVVHVTTGAGRGEEKFRILWNSDMGLTFPIWKINGAEPGLNHNHYISFLGSTIHSEYGVSGWFRQTDGVEPGNDGVSGGIRTHLVYRANSVLSFGMNNAFVMGRINMPACTEAFGNGSLTLFQRNPDFFPEQSIEGWAEDYDNERQDKRFTSGIYVSANIGKFLKFKINTGVDIYNADRFVWYGNRTPVGREENGRATVEGNTDFSYNASADLSFNRYLAGKHRVSAEILADLRGANVKRGAMTGSDFFSHTLRARGLSLYNSDPAIKTYEFDTFSYGAMADLGYEYAGIAGISATLRMEQTPRYNEKPDIYRSGNVWFDAAGAFFPGNELVSKMRLVGSYGEAGWDKVVPSIAYGDYLHDDYPSVPENLQMFYEGLIRLRSREITGKLETGFMLNRISLSAGFFDRTTGDNFYSYCFGEQNGYYWEKAPRSEHFTRTATTETQGFEAEVKAQLIKKDGLSWNVSTGFAYNASQIIEIGDYDLPSSTFGDGLVSTVNVLGYEASSFYGYRTDENGLPMDITGDGVVNRYDRQVLGSPMPKFYGTAGTSLTYGAFSLSMLATWAAGHEFLNLNRVFFEDGPTYEITDRHLVRGDYLRLSRLCASYSIPLKEQSFVKAVKLSLTGYDVLTYSVAQRWNPAALGVDYGTCPTSAAMLLGVSLTFGRE